MTDKNNIMEDKDNIVDKENMEDMNNMAEKDNMADKNTIIEKLLEQGYGQRAADLVAGEMVEVAPELKPLVDEWLQGKQSDYSTEGYSILGLIEERKMTYPAALLTIDWLLKEPDPALEALKKRKK